MSQPLRAANVIAPFSISSSFTLMCREILLTDTHCECLPASRSFTPLHRRRARGSYERDGALESRVAMAEYSTLSKSESPMWCWLVSDPRRENSRNAINLLDHLASKEGRRGQH